MALKTVLENTLSMKVTKSGTEIHVSRGEDEWEYEVGRG